MAGSRDAKAPRDIRAHTAQITDTVSSIAGRQVHLSARLLPTSRPKWKPLVFEERLSKPSRSDSDAASVCMSTVPSVISRCDSVPSRGIVVLFTTPDPLV